jgi:hypothetical protein
LIISVLCLLFKSCKSTENTKEKDKLERKDSTDDVRDDQMEIMKKKWDNRIIKVIVN